MQKPSQWDAGAWSREGHDSGVTHWMLGRSRTSGHGDWGWGGAWAELLEKGQRVGRGAPGFASFPATVVRLSARDRGRAALSRVGRQGVQDCSRGGDCSLVSQ